MKPLFEQIELACENLGLQESCFGITHRSSDIEYIEYYGYVFEIEVKKHAHPEFFGIANIIFECTMYFQGNSTSSTITDKQSLIQFIQDNIF